MKDSPIKFVGILFAGLAWGIIIAILGGCCTHPADRKPRHYSIDSGSGRKVEPLKHFSP